MRFVVLLFLLLPGCGWLHALSHSPQAAVDYFDWARERNERGTYEEAVEILEELGAPYCQFELSKDDYPILFPVLGYKYSVYHIDSNAVVYPLGDHEKLAHELAHAVTFRGHPTDRCLHQIAATAVQREFTPVSSASRR